MIRIILLALTASLSIVKAQYEPENYMSNNWAMEDMSNPYGAPSFGVNQKGVYFWRPKDEWYFKTTMARVSDTDSPDGIGYVSFVSTHTSGSYHPVGVGFGSSASGTQYSIDMSALHGDTVFIEVENKSDQHLNIRVGLKDVNNNLIDTKAGTSLTNIPSGIIDMDLPAKSIRSKKFVYQGGFYAEWGDVNKCTDWSNPNAKTTPCAIKRFDFSKVVGANITINSNNPQNVGVDNAEVRIRKMQFGNAPIAITNIEKHKMLQNADLYIISHPIHDSWLVLNKEIKQGFVFDTNGKLHLKINNTDKIECSQLKSGMYLIKTDQNILKFIVNNNN